MLGIPRSLSLGIAVLVTVILLNIANVSSQESESKAIAPPKESLLVQMVN